MWVAEGLGITSIDMVEDDWVIMPTPPCGSSRPLARRGASLTLLHFDTTTCASKNLRAIIESQQLAMLVNTYNIHFKQCSNGRNKVT